MQLLFWTQGIHTIAIGISIDSDKLLFATEHLGFLPFL